MRFASLRAHPVVTVSVIVLVVLAGLIAFRLTSSGAKTDGRKGRVITVGIMTLVREDLPVRLVYTADIQPFEQVMVFSRVDGYIAKIHVEKGDLVKTNQLLVEIDHTDYVHAINRAKANLVAARADVSRQEVNIRNAALTLERMRSLIQQQFVAQQDVDNAQVTYDMALAQLESLRAQVRQLEVALQQAETNLTYSYIRAPFTGYVAERNLDAGAYVTGSTASTSTMSRGILTLHQIDTVRTLVEVVERDIPRMVVGQRAEVRTDAYPDRIFVGQVTRVVQALSRATRTMTVEVDLPNSDHALKGGMFARVEIVVETHPQAILIPVDALTRLEDLQYVYVFRDGKAWRIPVETGARLDQRIEVVKGLTGQEAVIVSGKDLVSHGAPVEARPVDPAPRATPPAGTSA